MANTPQSKQHALVEAFRKAGIDVTIRESGSSFNEVVLTDDTGRKYRVSKDLKVKPAFRYSVESFPAETCVADIADTASRKSYVKTRKFRRGKVKLVKGNKNITKFGKQKA